MELRQIEYFCMVGKLNSFTRAAEQLHIAQPSITQAIRKLEQELGVQLFDRSKKRALLTAEGKAFWDRMELWLNDLAQAVQEVQDFKNLRKGTFKVGIPPMIEAYLFPEIFSSFKQQQPGLNLIAFEESSSLEAAVKLENNELDLAIIILPETSETLDSLVIVREQLVLCLHKEHWLAKRQAAKFEQLKNEQFILLKEGAYQHQIVISRCLRQNFMPNTIFSSNQIKTIKGLVANGLGISLLMEMVVRNDPAIIAIPLDEPIVFDIGLAWKKDQCLSTAAKAFVKFIEQRYTTTGAE
ncbi:LysR family transcriptional regulator|uniref:Transcriptional regulator, LysR family n=1 Tax=Dendrosporobacter quercicolus TaxID=146817 RepID=A0A1G9VRJ8_9FIRM|nr:LysR family transcriptional regulator [Dendrosporobacter quercicolus]NSL47826.1 LysR family transcriptional regulator [Dendrosporobacter quercicolus DSM 1736]SDM74601.1 transcriptional regulator, LysR family [Dendrosporobacter quercicolus]